MRNGTDRYFEEFLYISKQTTWLILHFYPKKKKNAEIYDVINKFTNLHSSVVQWL